MPPVTDNGNDVAEAAADIDPTASFDDADASDDEPIVTGTSDDPEGTCESLYIRHSNCKKLLLAMSYGLIDGVRIRGVTSVEPYKSTKKKVAFIPNKDVLIKEIYRRADSSAERRPRMSSKKIEDLRSWLQENPITNPTDVAFLQKEEGSFRDSLQAALEETANKPPDSANWTSHLPYLRLYHCMVEDEVVEAFLCRHNCLDRPALDARNSSERPAPFEEVIANKFNDPDYSPTTRAYPDLHDDFRQPIPLPLSSMPGLVTPDFIGNKLNDTKTKALHVSTASLVHIIASKYIRVLTICLCVNLYKDNIQMG